MNDASDRKTNPAEPSASAQGAPEPVNYDSAERKVRGGLGFALACLVIVGAASFLSVVRMRQDAAWVQHTSEVIGHLESLLSTTTDAETGQRGYDVTEREQAEMKMRSQLARLGLLDRITRGRWSDLPQQRGVMIELQSDLAPDLPEVMGVESEIREALINLIFNAVDAMPKGGTLTLKTKTREGGPGASEEARSMVDVEVTDTGVGMAENTRRRCFEPFFTTKGERGTGLGLPMVYGVVQRHSADIEIESAVGKGTTVRLSFTRPALVTRAADPAATTQPLRARRSRVLVVDDDPILLKSLRDTLETDGHKVVAARRESTSSMRRTRAANRSTL